MEIDARVFFKIMTLHEWIGEEIWSSMAKQKYRWMLETQKSGNKTSSWEIGLNIRSPKVGQDQGPEE